MEQFKCRSCKRHWSTNYCPVCRSTIDRTIYDKENKDFNELPETIDNFNNNHSSFLNRKINKLYADEKIAIKFFNIEKNELILSPYGYECLIQLYLKNKFLSEGIDIISSRRLVGLGKEGKEEFDIVFSFEISEYRYTTIIECKHYGKQSKKLRVVERDDIRLFRDRCSNSFPNCKLLLVTTTNFSDTAMLFSKKNNIELLSINYNNANVLRAFQEIMIGPSIYLNGNIRLRANTMVPNICKRIKKGEIHYYDLYKFCNLNNIYEENFLKHIVPFVIVNTVYRPKASDRIECKNKIIDHLCQPNNKKELPIQTINKKIIIKIIYSFILVAILVIFLYFYKIKLIR